VNLTVLEHEVHPDAVYDGAGDDEALARAAVVRHPAAWEQIFERHYATVFGFVRYRLRGADEAEDIASQVFEVAFTRADRFDYRGVPIEAWLIGIARNLVRDHIKKLGRRGVSEELDESNSPPEPDVASTIDLRQDLAAAMHTLTEDQREVIALRFLLDKPVAETAGLMHRSEDAVKNLQRRAPCDAPSPCHSLIPGGRAMTADRIDELLDKALASGTIPADATPAERAEIERMMQAMGQLQSDRSAVEEEARASLPTARARFQRYVSASQATETATKPAARPRPGLLGRFFAGGTVRVLAASVGAITVLAVVALVAWQVGFDGTESAYAQVVQPGDYVQVEGVVDQSRDGRLRVTSEIGPLDVEISDTTSLVDGGGAIDASGLSAGDRVLVAGIAGKNRTLQAQTLSRGAHQDGPSPRLISFKRLRSVQQDIEGEVMTFTVSPDGARGAILVEAGDGQRYLVPIDGPSAEQILSKAATALGQQVRITDTSGVTAGTYRVEVPEQEHGRGRPALASVRGILTAIGRRPSAGDRPTVAIATVRTADGPVTVALRPQARIFPGQSGLDVSAGLTADAVGHTVAITGGVERATGAVVADVVILGPMPER
jgi:RNA polymerase sigma-70 factor (ECF subfamily)